MCQRTIYNFYVLLLCCCCWILLLLVVVAVAGVVVPLSHDEASIVGAEQLWVKDLLNVPTQYQSQRGMKAILAMLHGECSDQSAAMSHSNLTQSLVMWLLLLFTVYIVPLKGNLLRSTPSPSSVKQSIWCYRRWDSFTKKMLCLSDVDVSQSRPWPYLCLRGWNAHHWISPERGCWRIHMQGSQHCRQRLCQGQARGQRSGSLKFLLNHLLGIFRYCRPKSINQSKFIWYPFKIPTQRRSRPRPRGKEQSWEGGGIENRHHLGGALEVFLFMVIYLHVM